MSDKNRILIGIDPDIDKSGVAIDNCSTITLCILRFFNLFDMFKELKSLDIPMLVVVEGGWLNKGNWHKKKEGSAALNAKIGSHTGANHEVGRKIVEMLEYLEISHKVVRPTKSKVNAKLFKMITGINKRTNQEQRDAYMLIHNLKIKK
tara:strand:+ start:3164 stop:3610 length:447 start_codon:yes stop_codon:yes gene_type:complete